MIQYYKSNDKGLRMNKKLFKYYMIRGMGRCVLELQSTKSVDKYKELVLWACTHNIAYDPQCESVRASYVYSLTRFFGDDDIFVSAIINAIKRRSRYSDWDFKHMYELLELFASDGNEAARDALISEFEELISELNKKRRFNAYDHERDRLETVCISLLSAFGKALAPYIARALGSLFRHNPRYCGEDFDWFMICLSRELDKKKLKKLLGEETDEVIIFFEEFCKTVNSEDKYVRREVTIPNADDVVNEVDTWGRLSPASRVRFGRRADDSERLKLAYAILEEEDEDRKAELLSTFEFKSEGFPLEHKPIIEYTRSDNERLRDTAFGVLKYCRSDAVRNYALELLSSGENTSHALSMLIMNYTPAHKKMLLDALYDLKIDYTDSTDWHGLGMQILDAYEKGVHLPKEFLMYIYETTLCSCCREYALAELAKHRWLTMEIIEECRYDSKRSISEYVNRYYKPQK